MADINPVMTGFPGDGFREIGGVDGEMFTDLPGQV
jgi:hypothetical protein